nr:NADH dehydrogenase subunit 5 [Cichlidogyrus cirratus]
MLSFILIALFPALTLLAGLKWLGYGGLDFMGLSNNFVALESGANINDYLCFAMLVFCGLISLLFSLHYFWWAYNNLNLLILLFLGVMGALVASEDYLSSLLWWEYLGVVSFYLILYYGNFDAVFAGNSTIVASRLGDVGFFLLVGYFLTGSGMFLLGTLGILSIILTKSAVIPFCSWLLEAMRAPTPVSCLVHSSTLVAAGVWFISSYGGLLIGPQEADILIILCTSTVFVSGLVASVYSDIKKIVALSTCNNISWCVLYYILGSPLLCVCQLICHGVGKCMLFIAVGDSLSSASGSQNKSSFTWSPQNSLVGSISVTCLSVAVAGFPFLGVFFTKHFFLNGVLFNSGIVLSISLVGCILLSYVYSVRLVLLVLGPSGINAQWINNTYYALSAVSGVCGAMGYLAVNFLEEAAELNSFWGVWVLFTNLLGIFLGFLNYKNAVGCEYLASFSYNDTVVLFYNSFLAQLGNLSSVLFNFRWEVLTAGYVVSGSLLNKLSLMSMPVALVLLLILSAV